MSDCDGRVKVLLDVGECYEVSVDRPVQPGGDDLVLVQADRGHDVLMVEVNTQSVWYRPHLHRDQTQLTARLPAPDPHRHVHTPADDDGLVQGQAGHASYWKNVDWFRGKNLDLYAWRLMQWSSHRH